jgi:hypothetical protein
VLGWAIIEIFSMSDDNNKELLEAVLYIQTDLDKKDKVKLKEKLEDLKKETIAENKQLAEECTKKTRVLEELKNKLKDGEAKLAESVGGKANTKGEVTLSKSKGEQYTSFLSSNFYEFGKIRNMLEGKERQRINKLFAERAGSTGGDSLTHQKSMMATSEYIKPQKPTISLTYVKVKWIDRAKQVFQGLS